MPGDSGNSRQFDLEPAAELTEAPKPDTDVVCQALASALAEAAKAQQWPIVATLAEQLRLRQPAPLGAGVLDFDAERRKRRREKQ
jgi:hypothetical protein